MTSLRTNGKNGLWWNIILALIFLFSIDFLDAAGILICAACLLCALLKGQRKVPKVILLMICFGVFYTASLFLYEPVSATDILKFLFLPALTYYLGFCYGKGMGSFSAFFKLTVIIVSGFFLHSLLNFISYIRIEGINLNAAYRLSYEFWRGNAQINVIMNSLYAAPAAFFCAGILITKTDKKSKIAALAALSVVIFSMMLYQNRTILLTLLIIFAAAFLFFMINHFSAKNMLFIIVVVAGLVVLWQANVFGVKNLFTASNIYSRLTNVLEADRLQIWWSFLKGDPLRYPFGGKQVELYLDKPYVHNMWLDTWWRVGFIPFICLIFITYDAVRTLRKLHTSCKTQEDKTSVTVISWLMFGLFFTFNVEPILEANPFIFYIPLILIGCSHGLLSSFKHTEKHEYFQEGFPYRAR